MVHKLDNRLTYQMAEGGDVHARCCLCVTASHPEVGRLGCRTQKPLPLTYQTQASYHARQTTPCRLVRAACPAQALC